MYSFCTQELFTRTHKHTHDDTHTFAVHYIKWRDKTAGYVATPNSNVQNLFKGVSIQLDAWAGSFKQCRVLNLCLWIFGKFKVAFVFRFVVARFHFEQWRVFLRHHLVVIYSDSFDDCDDNDENHGNEITVTFGTRPKYRLARIVLLLGLLLLLLLFYSCWFLVAIRWHWCAKASPTPSNNEWMLQKHIIHLRRLYTSPIAKGLKIYASVSFETWTAQVSQHIFTVNSQKKKIKATTTATKLVDKRIRSNERKEKS